MIRNYLLIAIRKLRKEKTYTFVNVFGLALGVACVLLILLFLRHEWSFDTFHTKSERIYRAWGQEDWGEGREFFYTITPVILGPTLEESIPEVEETVRIRAFTALVGPDDRRFTEEVRMVDAAFFRLFDFKLLQGRPFSHPNTVVITPAIAKKYFGDEDAVGKTIAIEVTDGPEDFVVSGIVADPPVESSIQFGLLIPFTKAPDVMNEQARTSWFNIFVETYVLLEEGVARERAEAKLPAMVQQVLGDEGKRAGYTLGLQPMTDIHLNTEYPVGIEPISSPLYSYMLGAIALLVLIVGSINFVTLSIGQSVRRAGEVGVRKAMGADRYDVMRQFWGEALLIVALATLVGSALARLALPTFSALAGRELSMVVEPWLIASLVALVIMIGLVAGIYPALVLSGLQPMEVLRGRLSFAGDRSLLRRGLIVVQFAISILMITGTLFVIRQMEYVRARDLGFDKEQVIVVRTGSGPEGAEMIAERMRTALQGDSRVQALAYSAFPMDEGWARFGFNDDAGRYREVMANVVSPDFLDAMEIEVLAGRGFSRERGADSMAVVVNEAFVREMDFASAEEVLGKRIPSASYPPHEIIGVVPDFNYESLHTAVRPLALVLHAGWLFRGSNDINVSSSMQRDISLRVEGGDLRSVVDLLETTWSTVAPDLPFEFYFLDDAIDAQYRQEERLSRIIATAAVLAVLIACLGLFGLAALTVVRRRKEIGVRKVLGATISDVVVLLSRDFVTLVGIAFLIALPLGYLLVQRWLADFAYRVEIEPWTFAAAGLLALVSALVTVSVQSVRAAAADPVESLRYE